MEDAEPPNEKVKFGQEVLYLDSWDRKLQYEWFAKVRKPQLSKFY